MGEVPPLEEEEEEDDDDEDDDEEEEEDDDEEEEEGYRGCYVFISKLHDRIGSKPVMDFDQQLVRRT